jgi:hypothetical protein
MRVASLGVVVLALAAGCESGAGMELDREQTEVFVQLSPIRKLDLVFMIDNSVGMPVKVAKLNDQLPTFFAALKGSSDGTYPDLRVAIIDSDLGTGGAYIAGSCGPNADNGQNAYGDVGNFQMRGASACGMTSSNALWIEYSKGSPVNFTGLGDNISRVFACLATNLSTVGCGEEHQLQAYEFALAAQNLHSGSYAKQNDFLRPEAYLGLVFLSDEDDCSAATNDGMFGDKPELRGESASLRCATRGHTCKGMNLSDGGPGYPTNQSFQAALTDCSARTDSCPNQTDGNTMGTDTSGPTSCSPLKSVKNLAKVIKGLKGDEASDKILVAGIFGWPLAGADGKTDLSQAEPYKIDLVPNPNTADTAHPYVYDLWPVCYDPDHRPTAATPVDWGFSAQPGLRLSAFIDEFGDSGLKFSICERDYRAAMQSIGSKLAAKIQNLCIDAKLADNDPSTPALDPDCRVFLQTPMVDGKSKAIIYQDAGQPPKCPPGATPDTVASDCWELVSDLATCPVRGQLVNLVRPSAEVAAGPLPEGTRLAMQCRTCTDGVSAVGCDYSRL